MKWVTPGLSKDTFTETAVLAAGWKETRIGPRIGIAVESSQTESNRSSGHSGYTI